MEVVFLIGILILSVVVHEVSHGYAADALGDPTARIAGRLTLNPVKHLDPVGSVIVPLFMALMPGGFIFGWARPVPYNPYNLGGSRFAEAWVALAGPLSNALIAIVFGIFIRFWGGLVSPLVLQLLVMVVMINIVLMLFNMVPIPPLDGSKVLFALFPEQYGRLRFTLERYGMIFVLIFILFLWQFLTPLIGWFFTLITGLGI